MLSLNGNGRRRLSTAVARTGLKHDSSPVGLASLVGDLDPGCRDIRQHLSVILHSTSPLLLPSPGFNLQRTLCHVLDIDTRATGLAVPSLAKGTEIDMSAVDQYLRERLEAVKADDEDEWLALSTEAIMEAAGRSGPTSVRVERSSVLGEINFDWTGLVLESHSNFSSARANVSVCNGRWMYEVTLGTAGIQQLGWATRICGFTHEMGVGDREDSYAFDGKRCKKWCKNHTTYGQPWVPGDVIGCCIDLDAGDISFYRNGTSLGNAFTEVPRLDAGEGYYPAVSLSQNERCELNFGGRPFRYAVTGFRPLQPPPYLRSHVHSRVGVSLTTSCTHTEGGAVGGKDPGCTDDKSKDTKMEEEMLDVGGSNVEGRVEEFVDAECCGELNGCSGVEGSAYALVAPRVKYLLSCLQRMVQLISSEAIGTRGPPERFQSVAPLTGPNLVVMASSVIRLLGPLLLIDMEVGLSQSGHSESAPRSQSGFVVWDVLVPFLLDTHRRSAPHDGESVGEAVRLLVHHLTSQELTACIAAVMDALACWCRTAPYDPAKFPYTASYPYLALATRLIRHPIWMLTWWQSAGFVECLEGLLTRKGPNKVDLAALLPVVWWSGAKEPLASEGKMRESSGALAGAIDKVEGMQLELCLQLLRFQPLESAATSNPKLLDRGSIFRGFLQHLIKRNSKVNSNSPPPGLSDGSVILSTYFVLLRLLSDPIAYERWKSTEKTRQSFASGREVAPKAQQAEYSEPAVRTSSCTISDGEASGRRESSGRSSGKDENGVAVSPVPFLRRHGWRRFPVSRFLESKVYGMDLPRLGGTYSHLVKAVQVSSAALGCDLAWDGDFRWDQEVCVRPPEEATGRGHAIDDGGDGAETSRVGCGGTENGLDGGCCDSRSGSVSGEGVSDAGGEGPGRSVTAVEGGVGGIRLDERDKESVKWERVGTRKEEDTEDQEMLDTMVLLYHLGLTSSLKQASFHMHSQMQSVAQLDEADRQIQRGDTLGLEQLREARSVYRDDVIENVRHCTWYRVSLFGRWKQGGMYHACVWIVQLLLATSCAGNVFSYVPECYVETLIDSFHALRRSDPPFGHPYMLLSEELSSLVTFLVRHFNDARIANPDVRDFLLQSISVLLQYQEYVVAFENNKAARERLVEALLQSFDNRFWIPVANIIIRLRRGFGFGKTVSNSANECCSPLFQALLREKCEKDEQLFAGFLNRLFNTLNWTITEFSVCLKEIKDLLDQHPPVQVQEMQQRKCLIMFELSCNLERILEFLCGELPRAFLCGPEMNLQRLCEVLVFVLNHTTVGPDAFLLDSTARRGLPSFEKINRASILAPIVGIILDLTAATARPLHGHTHNLASALAAVDPSASSMASFDFLLTFNWVDVFWNDPSLHRLPELSLFVNHLKGKVRQRRVLENQRRRSLTDADRVHEVGSHAVTEEPELCSICCAMEMDAVFVPCKHTSCRRCISRHLLNNPRCFFCNTIVTEVNDLASGLTEDTMKDVGSNISCDIDKSGLS